MRYAWKWNETIPEGKTKVIEMSCIETKNKSNEN